MITAFRGGEVFRFNYDDVLSSEQFAIRVLKSEAGEQSTVM
jgi:hypothetical protein